jgi:hypothetical protein
MRPKLVGKVEDVSMNIENNHRLNLNRIMALVAGSVFLLLLPGFFLYHTAIARGLIPAFLGGLSGTVGAALAPILLALYLWTNPLISRVGLLFWVIMGLTGVVTVGHFLVGRFADDSEVFLWASVAAALSITLFVIGNKLPLESQTFLNLCLAGLALMVATSFLFSEDSAFYTVRTSGLAEAEDVSTHQGFAHSIAVVSIVLIAGYSPNWLVQLAILSAALAGVFLSGARTELILLLISSVLMFVSQGIARRQFINRVILSSLLIATAFFAFISLEEVASNRMLGLLDLGEDQSVRMRSVLNAEAWETIKANPFFGDYMVYAQGVAGGVGSYAHNLLSAWVNLGLVGFLLYCTTLGAMLVVVVRGATIDCGGDRSWWRLSTLMAVYVVVGMIFSKVYVWPMFGFACGVVDRWLRVSVQHTATSATLDS